MYVTERETRKQRSRLPVKEIERNRSGSRRGKTGEMQGAKGEGEGAYLCT